MSVEPKRLDALYDVALDTEVSDRLVVVRRPPGGGDPLRLAVYVEQIRHAIEVGTDGRIVDWRTTFGLSTIGNAQGSTVAATLTPANTVSAPPAAASASAAAPVVDRLSSPVIVAPAANAIATAAAARSAFVVSPPATATAASVAPNLGQTTRQAPAAAASAAAPLPTLSQRTIVAPVAAATASRVAPLANVTVIVLGIASPERSPLVVSDDFNRADVNPLPTSQGWVAFGGTGNSPFKLVSNQMAVITAGAIRRAWYSPGAVNGNPGLPADLMDVFATVATKPATGEVVGVVARTNGPHGAIYDSYEFRVTVGAGGADDVVSWVHFKAGTGDIATLASTTFEIQDGDVLYARSIGAYMTGWILRGGTVVLTLEGVEATSPSTLGDAQRRGVLMSGTTGRLDDFGWVARPRTIASAPIPTNFGTGVRRAAPAIAYGGAFLVDAFGRDTVYGWRQPDSGPAWVVPSDVTVESFDVTGGRGRIRSNDSLSQRAKMFTTGALILSADWQATGRVRLVLDALSSHSFFELMLRVGDTASFAPRSYTFMRFEVDEDPLAGTPSGGQTPGTTGPILIATAGFRNSGGGESFADPKAIGLQVLPVGTTSSWWRFRYQQRAGKIEAAVWLDGGSEPADPQLIAGTLTDTTGPLGVQVYGGNGGHDVTWEVDDLVVEPLRNHLVKTGLVRAPAARAIAFRPRPFV